MKWYKKQTFRFSFVCLIAAGVMTSIGTSLVDGELNLSGLFFWAMAALLVLMSYLFRNNP